MNKKQAHSLLYSLYNVTATTVPGIDFLRININHKYHITITNIQKQ